MATGVTEQIGNRHDMVTGGHKESLCGHDMLTGVIEETHNDHDMMTRVLKESLCGHDMVTGVVQEEIRYHPHMVTAVQEEIPYCSPSTSSGKQKKARSTSQPPFRSENTPAKIEADQVLLTLQQLASSSRSANINNNINKISILPKSLTTTIPTFDGKSEKFELFEYFFQTSLKIHNQLTEEDKINYFHSLMRGDALQMFENNSSRNRKNLTEILTVFRRKYAKPHSIATAKHKFQQLVFNPVNQKLNDFLDELQKFAKDAFGVAAQAIIDQFIYAKMPPQLKKSINQAHLENGTYEQVITHLKRELELNGLEAPHELQINTVSHNTANTNADRLKTPCHHCKKPGRYRNQCRLLRKQREQTEENQNNPGSKNSVANTRTATSTIITTTRKTVTKLKESQKLFTHPVRRVGKQTTPEKKATLEPIQSIARLPGTEHRKDRIRSKREPAKMTGMKLFGLQPEI